MSRVLIGVSNTTYVEGKGYLLTGWYEEICQAFAQNGNVQGSLCVIEPKYKKNKKSKDGKKISLKNKIRLHFYKKLDKKLRRKGLI